ncbi:MAG: TonB-dependent receptor [Pseudomonadota bacterium]
MPFCVDLQSRRLPAICTGLVCLVAWHTPAVAQTLGVTELPGIVITTANKRPQVANVGQRGDQTDSPGDSGATAQTDANISIKTVTELRAAGVETISDLEKVFPGLVIRTRGNRAYGSITVRGVSSPDFYNPSVQVLVDGVPQASAAFTQDLLNIERVELLRGPQGVLYGANAFGGVLNIVTRKARRNEAQLSGTVSNLQPSTVGNATAVLVPGTLFLDTAFKRTWDRGEVDNTLTGDERIDSGIAFAGRASLRYAPANGPFDFALTYAYDKVRTHEEVYLRDSLVEAREYDVPFPVGLLDRKTHTASANWNYRLGNFFTLTGITAYQDVSYAREVQGFSTPESEEAISQEIRLAYTGPGPLAGVVGFYYRDSDFAREVEFRSDENEIGTTTTAGFGELTYRATARLDFTAGLRLTLDKSTIDYSLPTLSIQQSGTESFRSVQPRLGIGYKLTDSARAYASVSRGYKPGGFQHAIINPFSASDFAAYDPETAWNYEAGVQASLFNGALNFKSAVYHIVSKDKQIYTGVVPLQVLRNAGEAESTGIELEATVRPTDQLMITGSANLGRHKFTDFVDPISGTVFTGNRVPYAPDVTINLLGRYQFDSRLFNATPALVAAMRYVSTTYFDEGNTLSEDGVATFDAALELDWNNRTFLRLFANNLTDRVYRQYSFQSGPQVLSLPSQGRLIGLTVTQKF